MMSVHDRLYEFLEFKKLKASVFERKCGLSNGFCSKVNDNITDGSISLIQRAFPELDTNWLLTGFGDMIRQNVAEDPSVDFVAVVKMMKDMLEIGRQNAEANVVNAEANRTNAKNLERLIDVIEQKLV